MWRCCSRALIVPCDQTNNPSCSFFTKKKNKTQNWLILGTKCFSFTTLEEMEWFLLFTVAGVSLEMAVSPMNSHVIAKWHDCKKIVVLLCCMDSFFNKKIKKINQCLCIYHLMIWCVVLWPDVYTHVLIRRCLCML